jgi:hypothetical protein
MEEILKEILKELKYQTKIMEYLYDKKDTNQHDFKEHMKGIQDMVLSNPMIASVPEAKAMMQDMFEKMSGGKS